MSRCNDLAKALRVQTRTDGFTTSYLNNYDHLTIDERAKIYEIAIEDNGRANFVCSNAFLRDFFMATKKNFETIQERLKIAYVDPITGLIYINLNRNDGRFSLFSDM